jgi:hypothetical protein
VSLILVNAAQRHCIITLQGIDNAWATMAGGGITATTTPDPYSDVGEVIAGGLRAENIVLTTGFDPRHDLDWINELKRGVGEFRGTVTRQWTDENWTHLGDPEVYPDCLLIGYTPPATTASGDEAVFTITLATTGEAL